MAIKVLTEDNLLNIVEVDPLFKISNLPTEESFDGVATGAKLTRNITGSGSRSGTAGSSGPPTVSDSRYLNTLFTGSDPDPLSWHFIGLRLLYEGDLDFQSAPNIPTGAIISNVRITFDYSISCHVVVDGALGGALYMRIFPYGVRLVVGVVDAQKYFTTVNITFGSILLDESQSDSGTYEYNSDDTEPPFDYTTLVDNYGHLALTLTGYFQGGMVATGHPYETTIDYDIDISNFQMEVTYTSGDGPDPPYLEIEGDAGLVFDFDAFNPSDAGLVFDSSSIMLFNTVIADSGLVFDFSGMQWGNQLTSDAGLILNGTTGQFVLSADVSGIYTFVPDQHYDEILSRNTADNETQDVKIPDPQGKTGYYGG